ncbi:MAG: aldehyde dehydrogenase family protein, partial [Sediminibacterium sp.]|nr:aldehyde dehydrogenase family protein [Sediminibacterium sp.]
MHSTFLDIVNPFNQKIIGQLEVDTESTIRAKWELAKKSQILWSQFTLAERVAVLQKFSALLLTDIDQLSKLLTDEVGKPITQSRNEIRGAIARIEWLVSHAAQYIGEEWMIDSGDTREKILYEPLGVVANISAWNYPYLVGVNVLIPALVAGNAVLYKPSEFASLTGMAIHTLFIQAGVPEASIPIIIGAGDIGNMLLDLPLDGYFFTGSYNTGNKIFQKIANRSVACGLEMGGKDPLYVTNEIADIVSVAKATADGAFYNNGQSCCSVERIYVHADVYDQYVNAFVEEVRQYVIGNPRDETTYIGPLTRTAQISLLENQVQDALSKGAILQCGGKSSPVHQGNYFLPTVLTEVNHQMLVMQEESFGPIIGIMRVRNEEEAIQLMNDSEYGLTASVYT